jgi:aryl-alcohol dehydrogenase-like predicted oxidoreductase
MAQALGIGVMPWSPLRNGYLTGPPRWGAGLGWVRPVTDRGSGT